MKLLSAQHGHNVKNQLIVDDYQSFWGALIGLLIQPAQMKSILSHGTKDSLRMQAEKKIQKLEKKLDDSSSALIFHEKWRKKLYEYDQFLKKMDHCTHDYFTVNTVEGRVLDAVHISPNIYDDITPTEQYYTIHLLGAGQRVGNRMIDLYRESYQQNRNVIAFDYSNVGYSQGGRIPHLKRLIADASAIISCLLEQGVPANHITLHGFSLGGLVGTCLAAKYHKNELPINIYTTCTPMELNSPVLNVVERNLWFAPNFLKRFVTYLLNHYEWNVDAIELWDSIPDQYKEYSFIDVEETEKHAPDNFIPLSATIAAKQQLQASFDPYNEISKKLQIIDQGVTSTTLNERTKQNSIRYREILSGKPDGSHHRFYLNQDDKNRKNPHGTKHYLLHNKTTGYTPESLFDDFEAFVELRNQI